MMARVPRTKRAVETLSKCDPQFREFVELVYGGDLDAEAVWQDAFGPVSKDVPGQSDLSTSGNAKRRLAIAGTAIGAGLGVKEFGAGARQLLHGGGEAMKTGFLTRTGAKISPRAMAAIQSNPRAIGALRASGAGTMLGADLAATDELRKPKAGIGKRLVPIRKVGPSGLNDLTEGIVRGKLAMHEQNPVGQSILGRLGPKGQQAGADAKSGYGSTRAGATPQPGAGPGAPPAAPAPTQGMTPPAAAAKPAPGGIPNAGANPAQQGSMAYQAGAAGGNAMNALLTPTGRKVMAAGGVATLGHHLMSEHEQNTQPMFMDPNQGIYKRAPRAGDITWHGEISKVDNDKRLAFGYASVVSIGGVPVLDRQGDIISQDEIEKAAYDYVQKSRKGGDMHRRSIGVFGDDQPYHVSDLVESFVITDEKVAKMGLPDDIPRGWWIGFKVHDEDTWQLVKKGERTGFSIHGVGRRAPADMDQIMGYAA